MGESWQDRVAFAERFRHALHRQPELTWEEAGTAEMIRGVLTDLGIPWRACAGTGTVATLAGAGRAGQEAIALRADMDALPLTEQTGKTWQSEHAGRMHACGHDGHVAALIAASAWLKQHEGDLPTPVVLLFQPAEEGGHGAREMIKDGAMEGVGVIYGWHNWPGLPFGQLLCPDGAVMAGNGTFEIELRAKGGHASQPEATGDPILAASAVTLALQQIVARKVSPLIPVVVSVTSIDGVSAPTVIPGRVMLGGSIRVPDSQTREVVNSLICQIAKDAAAAWGVSADVRIEPRYEATINHAEPAARMRDTWQSLYGAEQVARGVPTPVMASEDFSYYLKEVPGAFALIGADDDESVPSAPLHSPIYDFNDKLIPRVAKLFSALAGAPQPAGI